MALLYSFVDKTDENDQACRVDSVAFIERFASGRQSSAIHFARPVSKQNPLYSINRFQNIFYYWKILYTFSFLDTILFVELFSKNKS